MGKTIVFALLVAAFGLNAQVSSYSAGSKEDLSRLAGKMLGDTNQARTALKNSDYHQAVQDVNQAQTDLKTVEARAHGATLIPVYREFVSVSILSPVQAEQRAHRQTLTKVSNGNAAVNEVAGEYTRVLVSTTVADNSLAAAKMALAKAEWKKADAALADVQEGVQIESVKSDMPLARARENLILARAAARQNHDLEAEAALEAASTALSKYASEGGPHAKEAQDLQNQIAGFALHLEAQPASAVTKINGWWNTLSDWFTYHNRSMQRS